jgi:hypothetical protein
MVVGETPGARAVGFTPGQLLNVEFAAGARETGYVQTGDVLAALTALGAPKPPAERSSQQHHPPTGRNRLAAAHAEDD